MENRLENRVFNAFHNIFEENLPRHQYKHKAAFESATQEFERSAHFIVFNSYDSFKNAKSRYFKKKRRQSHM